MESQYFNLQQWYGTHKTSQDITQTIYDTDKNMKQSTNMSIKLNLGHHQPETYTRILSTLFEYSCLFRI